MIDPFCSPWHAGAELETEKPIEAEAAYRRALAAESTFLDPYLNLGCMLCDAGRFGDAVELYRFGISHLPNEPLLHFNLGVALEDMSRTGEALSSYERCITLAPDFADAHFNAARIYETLATGCGQSGISMPTAGCRLCLMRRSSATREGL